MKPVGFYCDHRGERDGSQTHLENVDGVLTPVTSGVRDALVVGDKPSCPVQVPALVADPSLADQRTTVIAVLESAKRRAERAAETAMEMTAVLEEQNAQLIGYAQELIDRWDGDPADLEVVGHDLPNHPVANLRLYLTEIAP